MGSNIPMGLVVLASIFAGQSSCSKLRSWRTSSTFVAGTPPSKRYMSDAVVSDDGRLFIYGGCAPAGQTNDVHQLDLASLQWTSLDAAAQGTPPPATCGAGVAFLNRSLLVFGGLSLEGYVAGPYRFDLLTLTWSTLATTGPAPPPQGFSGVVTMSSRLYVYSGALNGDFLVSGILYGLDLATLAWTAYPANAVAPLRVFAGFVADSKRERLLHFGGITSKFDGLSNYLHAFPLSEGNWTRLTTTGAGPSPRYVCV
mmetsp:Transcript_37150/g.98853  ORF Transcript_37150/g.98853 Transcript_37150/m.98853 type:complete len:256 (+) Transcript_37150:1-768(+)